MWLVVGLGNPGASYQHHRHNAGFRVLETLADQVRIPWSTNKEQCLYGYGTWKGHPLVLAKPQTFMNLSGQALGFLTRLFRIETDQVLVVHDDIDLPLGRLRLKRNGGDGGHKGIRSIDEELATRDYLRLRFGVGRPPSHGDVIDYVLSGFLPEEEPCLQASVERAVEALQVCVRQGEVQAMNQFNRRPDVQINDRSTQAQPEEPGKFPGSKEE